MRLLFVVQRFHQGWGGAPESVRLTARRLAMRGIVCDVADRGQLHRNIARLTVLPLESDVGDEFDLSSVPAYDAVLIAGPWQSYWRTRSIIDRMRRGQPLFYLPRGGLADIEFSPRKWLKKIVYLRVFEQHFLRRADHIIYSSQLELNRSSRVSRFRDKAHIIPDHFQALADEKRAGRSGDNVTIGFMAEIGFRKGLLPFIQGLLAWSKSRDVTSTVRVLIAGAPRLDARAYFDAVRKLAAEAGPELEIRFIGAVPHGERGTFYAGCDIFVVPSLFESYCLTALEGLSAGCALVAAPALGVLEQLPSHPAVVVLRGWDPSQIAEGLDHAAESPDRDATSDFARQAIAELNERADALWLACLSRDCPIDEVRSA